MHRFLILSAFVLSSALVAPVVARADDHHDKRYYDRNGKDYHTWNNNEDRAYRQYLGEQHRDYRDFNRTNREPATAILHVAPHPSRQHALQG